MHLETLKVFCDLAETKSFSKAAEINGITQSAVSQQIRALEIKYQVFLVERNRKACGLTPEGKILLDSALRIVDTCRVLGERLGHSAGTFAGRIRIASEVSIGLHELPPLLDRFDDLHPEVEIAVQYLRAAEVYDALAAGQADLGFVAYPQNRPGVKFEIIEEDELVLICPPTHRLSSNAFVASADFKGENLIAFAPDSATIRGVDRQLRKHQIQLDAAIQFDNIESVKRAVEIKRGISIVPRNTVQAEVESGALIAIPFDGFRLVRPLAVIFKPARSQPAPVRAFIATLRGKTPVPESPAVLARAV